MKETTEMRIKRLTAELSSAKAELRNIQVTPELKANVLEKIKGDKKDAKTGYYQSYTGKFIIGSAIKKYGTTDKIKAETWLKAAKDYGL